MPVTPAVYTPLKNLAFNTGKIGEYFQNRTADYKFNGQGTPSVSHPQISYSGNSQGIHLVRIHFGKGHPVGPKAFDVKLPSPLPGTPESVAKRVAKLVEHHLSLLAHPLEGKTSLKINLKSGKSSLVDADGNFKEPEYKVGGQNTVYQCKEAADTNGHKISYGTTLANYTRHCAKKLQMIADSQGKNHADLGVATNKKKPSMPEYLQVISKTANNAAPDASQPNKQEGSPSPVGGPQRETTTGKEKTKTEAPQKKTSGDKRSEKKAKKTADEDQKRQNAVRKSITSFIKNDVSIFKCTGDGNCLFYAFRGDNDKAAAQDLRGRVAAVALDTVIPGDDVGKKDNYAHQVLASMNYNLEELSTLSRTRGALSDLYRSEMAKNGIYSDTTEIKGYVGLTGNSVYLVCHEGESTVGAAEEIKKFVRKADGSVEVLNLGVNSRSVLNQIFKDNKEAIWLYKTVDHFDRLRPNNS